MTDERELSAEEAFFEIFWPRYPRRVYRLRALRAWKKLKLKDSDQETLEAILATLERFRAREWARREEEHIPHPSTWLNGRPWEDER